MRSIPSSSIASATASRRLARRMIAGMRRCWATRCAPTRAAFARCSRSIRWWSNLREGSRMAEDLKQERNRLGNRVRELLWRFYPQMLGLTDDVAAPWFLDLWRLIPTPEKAARVREATVDR